MQTSVEISYYPLKEKFIEPIRNLIDRLNSHKGIIIQTNGMSTQLFGNYDLVMDILAKEIKKSFELPHSVFIIKIINADLNQV